LIPPIRSLREVVAGAKRVALVGVLGLSLIGCTKSTAPQLPSVDPAPPSVPTDAITPATTATDPSVTAMALTRTVGLNPMDAGAWNDLSLAYRRMGYPHAAAQAAERAWSLKPNLPGAAFNAGIALVLSEKELDRAEGYLKQAGQSADALYWLAEAQAMNGFKDAAKVTLTDLLRRYPDDKEAKGALAALLPDLDGDGKPDVVDFQRDKLLSVRLANGIETLHIDIDPMKFPTPFGATVIETGEPTPALLVGLIPYWNAYRFSPKTGQMVLVGKGPGQAIWHQGSKQIESSYVDFGLITGTVQRWQQGQLQVLQTWTTGTKEDPPRLSPKTEIALVAALQEDPQWYLFATPALAQAFPRAPRQQVFVRSVNGAWIVETMKNGSVLETHQVEMAQQGDYWVVTVIH
jgi:tetratricopeptide (TPR) repeat protein